MIAKETLYLAADRETVVKEGDPKAQYLLVREGHELNDTIAEKYGVKGDKSPEPANPAAPASSPAAEPSKTSAPAAPVKKSASKKTAAARAKK